MLFPRLFPFFLFVSAVSLGFAQTDIKVLGDSISYGIGASSEDKRYSTLLADALGVGEINASISGGTLIDKSYVAHMYDYWEDLFLTGDPEDYALIYLGTNDTGWIATHPDDGDVFEERLDTIVQGLLDYGYRRDRIILCTPYYFGGLEPARTRVWEAIHDTAQAHGVVFADFWDHAGSWGWKSGYLPDGIHPNNEGHALLRDWILEALSEHSGAPFVSLTAPAEGTQVLEDESVKLTADAGDDSAIVEVRFYLDDALVQTVTNEPYEFVWTAIGLGLHAIKAIAEDDDGQTAEDEVQVTVVEGFPPTVTLTAPTTDPFLYVDESLTVSAEAEDSDGTVERVDFYVDDVLAHSDTSAPYDYSLTCEVEAAYTIFARAIDNAGNQADSETRTVTFLPRPDDGVVAAINCGSSEALVISNGLAYTADEYVSGGSSRFKVQEIAQTDDDALYHSYRVGSFSYAIPLEHGRYEVTLQFAEPYWGSVGSRVFSITVEGDESHADLDLVELYGKATAADVVISPVTVEDGILDLALTPSVDGAVLSAIVVRALDPATLTPVELWMQAELGTTSNDLGSDEDGDGFDLLTEYAFDLNPGQIDARTGLVSMQTSQETVISFPRDPEKTDLLYIVESSSDLKAWTEHFGADRNDIPNNTGSRHTVSLPMNGERLFVRLRVTLAR